MKQIIKNIPIIGSVARQINKKWFNPPKPFEDSGSYWKNRYKAGGDSGKGSYNEFAEFKAEILNEFVSENGINSVIEYGCGDGNQLSLAKYPKYIGFDVSSEIISLCTNTFSKDETKGFKVMDDYDGETADLTLSLDVVYHLVEDSVFESYMNRLFDSSEKFVIVYSTDTDNNPSDVAEHVRHRNFSKWISDNKPQWKLIKHIPNRHPIDDQPESERSLDFYIYSKV